MTDEELHKAWMKGTSITSIARAERVTKGVVAGWIRTLRRHEGIERWPNRDFRRNSNRKGGTVKVPQKAPKVTLPPLKSLDV